MNEQACFTSFAQWYQACFPQVYRHLCAQFGHCEQAEDLTQEVFVKDWRIWPPSSTENLSGWLATSVIRTARDAWRQRRTRLPSQLLDRLLHWRDEVASPLDEAEVTHQRLGNLHYREHTAALMLAPGYQDAIREAVQLCVCAEERGCHRLPVAQLIQEALPMLVSPWEART